MVENEIQKKLNEIKDLPTLPVIAMELNSMLQAEDSTVDKVAANIEKDQAIATKVLKLINSAFFGVRSQVTNIHDAVVLLGFNSIRNIVLSVSVIKAFSKNDAGDKFDISEFWKHSIAVAITSKYISGQSGIGEPEDGFTGGLLHDIGKIILAQYFTAQFFQIVNDMEKEYLPFSIAEKQYLAGMGHAKIGSFLAEKWKFPLNLSELLKNHHSVSDTLSGLGAVVHTADIIVNIQSINASSLAVEQKKTKMPVINHKAVEKMKEYFATSREWYPELAESIEEACSFFVDGSAKYTEG